MVEEVPADAAEPSATALCQDDVLLCVFEFLEPRDLGACAGTCRAWNRVLTHNPGPWRATALRLGFVWEPASCADARAARAGGWKQLLSREVSLEHRWASDTALHARAVGAGHRHWVPCILMEERTRQLATCSYDGTIRFWHDAEAPLPQCFQVLTAGAGVGAGAAMEGFSSIALASPHDDGPAILAAGSELGNVHAWEVWRPEDADDASLAAAEAANQRHEPQRVPDAPNAADDAMHVAPAGLGGAGAAAAMAALDADLAAEAPFDVALGAALALQQRRPHFSRKLDQWNGAHDFVQSILLLSDAAGACQGIVSGGDSGHITLHQCGAAHAKLRLDAHAGAVMCLGATEGGNELISGSVDHTVRLWDLGAGGRCKALFTGHTRSVHCLTLGKASPFGPPVLFTGSRDHSIRLWDMRTRRCEHVLRGHAGSVTCIGAHGWKLLSGAPRSRRDRAEIAPRSRRDRA